LTFSYAGFSVTLPGRGDWLIVSSFSEQGLFPMKKIVPGSPSGPKPDMGPMKKPPIGKQAKAGNGRKMTPAGRAGRKVV